MPMVKRKPGRPAKPVTTALVAGRISLHDVGRLRALTERLGTTTTRALRLVVALGLDAIEREAKQRK